MTPIIHVHDLSFRYGESVILENVSFDIQLGEFVGIIGPNGSGKTTLLKLLLGLATPYSGQVLMFNQPAKVGLNAAKIGYIPQKVTQLETRFPMTVEEVVTLGRINKKAVFRRLGKEDTLAVSKALETVELNDLRHRLITDLSGGQQQRAFIAKALAGQPQLLILDEPTVGIDVESQENFYALLAELHKKHGLTIVLVSHDVDVVTKQVSSVLCLNKTVVYHGNPKSFLSANYLEKLYGSHTRFVMHGH